jgi:YidC/Oxa1 family membrane protein insertase
MPTPPRGLGPGSPDETRNLILFAVLMMVFLYGYDFFIAGPQRQATVRAQQQAHQEQQVAPPPKPVLARPAAIAAVSRVAINNARVAGSIALTGARFDDLALKGYRQTADKNSPDVSLLNPINAKGGYDSYLGWGDPYTNEDVVALHTPWTAPEGASLTPQTPLTLSYTSPDGLAFTRVIAIDDQYMFTITDTIVNNGAARRALRPFSVVRREDTPPDFAPNLNVHQGMVGILGPDHQLQDKTYQQARALVQDKAKGKQPADAPLMQIAGPGGWLGISDHYWLAALIPPQDENLNVRFDANPQDNYIEYRASYWGKARAIEPGASVTYTQRLFAGAKRVDVLQGYEKSLAIPDFDRAIDWGNIFWFLTRPLYALLDFLGSHVGSFGLAILLTTIVVKLVLFPLVNSSFESMSKMRKIQPKMKELQDRYAADKERQQQELMKLYQAEKINPLAGCLPVLAQIPVFWGLYKTLSITIEMRHAPFIGWIKDLSAPDPTNIFNLFGLLPYDPTHIPIIGAFLHIALLPIIYGVSLFATQSLSPQAPDPTQRMVFRFMPIFMTFLFASYSAGLLVYWIWSNLLSFLQQYFIMRKNGVETEIDKLIEKYFVKPAPTA